MSVRAAKRRGTWTQKVLLNSFSIVIFQANHIYIHLGLRPMPSWCDSSCARVTLWRDQSALVLWSNGQSSSGGIFCFYIMYEMFYECISIYIFVCTFQYVFIHVMFCGRICCLIISCGINVILCGILCVCCLVCCQRWGSLTFWCCTNIFFFVRQGY